jgi:hypothetical protein
LSEQKQKSAEANAQRQAGTSEEANPLGESSESESVSGGDDEVAEVQVSAQIRKHIVFDVEPDAKIVQPAAASREWSPVDEGDGDAANKSNDQPSSSKGGGEGEGLAGTSSARSPIASTIVEGEVLTGLTQVKNMAALSKLRKLKEKKVRLHYEL